MRTFDEMEKAVLAYVERHNLGPMKASSRYPDKLYYSYTTMNWTKLEAKINNGRTTFKVDGKVTSIYK
jgi:hypothetical protein